MLSPCSAVLLIAWFLSGPPRMVLVGGCCSFPPPTTGHLSMYSAYLSCGHIPSVTQDCFDCHHLPHSVVIWKWQISHCVRVAVEKPSRALVVGRSLGDEVLLRREKLSGFLLFSVNSEHLGAVYHEILSRANPYHFKQLGNPCGWPGTKSLASLIFGTFNLQLTSGATLISNLKPSHL